MTSEVLIPDPQQQVEQQQQQQEQQQQEEEGQKQRQEQQQQQEGQKQQQQQQEEQKQQQKQEKKNVQVVAVAVVQRRGVMSSVLRGLYWPFGIVVRVCRGVWWVLGFGPPQEKVQLSPSSSSSPERHNVSGRKRVRGLTRLLLFILPRWLQRALGFPVYSSIGRCVSPEIRESPTKPSGKGSKRKQDELDEEDYMEEEEVQGEEVEEEDGHQTWVEALNEELDDEDDGPEMDPDYEPSTVETESEEYRSHNNTESDLEVEEKDVVVMGDGKSEAPDINAVVADPV